MRHKGNPQNDSETRMTAELLAYREIVSDFDKSIVGSRRGE